MTDLLDAETVPEDGMGTPPETSAVGSDTPTAEVEGEVVACALIDCPGTFIVLPEARGARPIYCEPHRGRSPEARRIRREWEKEHGKRENPKQANTDKAPKITVDLGGPGGKKTPKGSLSAAERAAIEQRCVQISQVAAAFVLMATNGPHKEADANDIAVGGKAVAAATADLAVYEPWLRVIGAGGEVSDRAQAWGKFLLAIAAMTSPILVRHEVLKGGVAELATTILGNGQSVTTA